ncbi:MAG TPA: MBL fold metallo-hydrolase [Planctomycetota bacterium]|nr:MBL fold metallo-hydrolase [Planctomycetota bacterium]
MHRQTLRSLSAFFIFAGLLLLPGCDFVVQPLGGAEGRTLVYVAQGKGGAPNGGIVCTRVGAVVIDPMLSPTLGDLLNTQAQAKSKVFWDNFHASRKEKPRTQAPPVLYVFNTTYRGSHTFGNQSFDKADVISTSKAKERMEADGAAMRAELRDLWKVPGLEGHATTSATLTVDEGAFNLDTPDVKIKFVAVGDCVGEGDAVVYLPVQKVLFAGDVVVPKFVPYYKGRSLSIRNWIETLKKLDTWDIETVVPGHGDVAKKDAIRQQREFLEALVTEVREQIKAGKTAEQAAAAVKLPKYADWAHYNDWLGENVKLVYRELKEKGDERASAADGGASVAKPAGISQPDGFK